MTRRTSAITRRGGRPYVLAPGAREYDHAQGRCDDTCTIDTCRRAYRSALGLTRRDAMLSADAAAEDYSRWWHAGIHGAP